MGTLGHQPYASAFDVKEIDDVWTEGYERQNRDEPSVLIGKSSIKSAANDLKALAKELKIPLSDFIQIYVGLNISRLCAIRRVDSDKMDENLGGLGDVITGGLYEIKEEVNHVVQSLDLVREAIEGMKNSR